MSQFNVTKYNTCSSFFKRNTYQLEIVSKPSKPSKNKNKNKSNTNKSNRVSDDDFNELMKENVVEKNNEVKLIDHLNKITDSRIVEQLIQDQLMGEDLLNRIKYETIQGSQLLKYVLKKYNDPSNYDWVKPENYGLSLSYLLSNNTTEQLLCLFLIQDYTKSLEFPKITYKDKQVYFLRTIFQLLFTYDIIEESTFWMWQDLLVDIVDVDKDTKNKICIQTTEFFNILKLTFTEEDYENKEYYENKENKENKEIDKNENVLDKETDIESKQDLNNRIDKYKVPEEQDYNMDDDNFNLDDL